jgi:hypothetical protein
MASLCSQEAIMQVLERHVMRSTCPVRYGGRDQLLLWSPIVVAKDSIEIIIIGVRAYLYSTWHNSCFSLDRHNIFSMQVTCMRISLTGIAWCAPLEFVLEIRRQQHMIARPDERKGQP